MSQVVSPQLIIAIFGIMLIGTLVLGGNNKKDSIHAQEFDGRKDQEIDRFLGK